MASPGGFALGQAPSSPSLSAVSGGDQSKDTSFSSAVGGSMSTSFTLSPSRPATAFQPPAAVKLKPDPLWTQWPPSSVTASVVMCSDLQTIFVFGGFENVRGEVFNTVYKIDVATMQYAQVRECAGTVPSGRNGHSATYWRDGKIVVFGGETESGQCVNELYVFDMNTNTWTRPETHGPRPRGRSRHAAVLSECGTMVFFSGGMIPDPTLQQGHTLLRDIFALNLQTMTWSESRRFVARYDHVAAVDDGKVWVFGGLTPDMGRVRDIVWFDLNTFQIASMRFRSSSGSDSDAGSDEEAEDDDEDDDADDAADDDEYNEPARQRYGHVQFRSGMHFYGACGNKMVDFVTEDLADHDVVSSISCFDLAEGHWRQLVDESVDIFSGYQWNYLVMDGTTAYLLGSQLGADPETLAYLLKVDLKQCGISSPVPTAKAASTLLPNSLNSDLGLLFDDKDTSDFVVTGIPDSCAFFEDEYFDDPAAAAAPGAPGAPARTSSSATADALSVSDPIYVHSIILQARWPHFKRLCNSRMREYHHRRMHIPETISTVRALLCYLYIDAIPVSADTSTVARLLVLANLYGLPRLRDLCLERIQLGFEVDAAALVWERAATAREDVLRKVVAKFCMKHWGRVVRTRSFRALTRQAMIELCEEIDVEGAVVPGKAKRRRPKSDRPAGGASANSSTASVGGMWDSAGPRRRNSFLHPERPPGGIPPSFGALFNEAEPDNFDVVME
ncbi:uncharacterized protein V1510DRAFT_401641 [Dipodascopsis tothii]|uniref:uncharacterized protein n=1 Tax=Dipodascopsis tothii TaxID=44089 RepID=UPI0034CDC707